MNIKDAIESKVLYKRPIKSRLMSLDIDQERKDGPYFGCDVVTRYRVQISLLMTNPSNASIDELNRSKEIAAKKINDFIYGELKGRCAPILYELKNILLAENYSQDAVEFLAELESIILEQ